MIIFFSCFLNGEFPFILDYNAFQVMFYDEEY